MIEVKGLVKRYGHIQALRGINTSFPTGSFTTVFGPNGAGKTTLLRILSTLTHPTAGEVMVNGLDLFEEQETIRGEIGVISHHSFLYGHLSAAENLVFYGRLYGLGDPVGRAEKLLEEVGLYDRRHDETRTFSRGMEQRLCIARALLHDPSIILLDEPYTGLDQHAALILRRILGELSDGHRTILMTTHNLARGLEGCDRVVIQVKGKVMFAADRNEVEPSSFEKLYFETVGKRQ